MGGNGKQFNQGQLKWKSREKKVGNRKFVNLELEKKSTLAENLYIFILKKREGLIKEKICKHFL